MPLTPGHNNDKKIIRVEENNTEIDCIKNLQCHCTAGQKVEQQRLLIKKHSTKNCDTEKMNNRETDTNGEGPDVRTFDTCDLRRTC